MCSGTVCGPGFPLNCSRIRALFSLSQSSGFSVSNSIPPSAPIHVLLSEQAHTTIRTWRTCDLLDRAREPLASAESPQAEGVGKDDTDGDGGVVERLRVDWVELWKTKDDGDKGDPEHGSDSDWV
jgi:hypothetical protein